MGQKQRQIKSVSASPYTWAIRFRLSQARKTPVTKIIGPVLVIVALTLYVVASYIIESSENFKSIFGFIIFLALILGTVGLLIVIVGGIINLRK